MLQIVYVSSAVGAPDTAEILAVSRRNNKRDGVTGLLYADGRRFMQALEGPEAMVERTFERIRHDPRHRATVILSRRTVAAREFGEGEMAARDTGEESSAFIARVQALVAGADASVRATFESFVKLRQEA